MHTRSLWALVFALLFLLPAATVEGQKVQPSERGPWEINLFAGGFDDKFEFDPDGSDFYIDPDRNVLVRAWPELPPPVHHRSLRYLCRASMGASFRLTWLRWAGT